jgi:hypothetical protein
MTEDDVLVLGLLVLMSVFLFQTVVAVATSPKARRRRLPIFASYCGRQGGWFVEYQGRCLAALTDPRFVDMFWDSYRIEIVTDDPRRHSSSCPTGTGGWSVNSFTGAGSSARQPRASCRRGTLSLSPGA